uniref:Dehydrogenase/reductase SDR family member 11 n=2 Tax=Pseudocrenilabrinae TaxID=318546 RepID=A0A3B4F6E0_9CICH
MERWRGRVALVTGASAGIGAAVAVELVRLGMKVVGCARDV